MSSSGHLQQYAILLKCRQVAARRNVIITGAVFGVSIALGLVSSVLAPPNSQSLFLGLALVIAFGLIVVSQWSQYETLKEIMRLVNELAAMGESAPISMDKV